MNELLINLGKYKTIIDILPIMVGVVYYKYLSKPLFYFLLYLSVSLVINLSEQLLIWACLNYDSFYQYISTKWNINNTFFLSIFVRLNIYVFLGLFFSTLFLKSIGKKIKIISILLFFIAIIICIYVDGFLSFGRINGIIVQIYVICFSLIYLIKVILMKLRYSLFKNSYFLICLGLIVLFITGFLFPLFADSLKAIEMSLFVMITFFQHIISILTITLYSFAFYYSQNLKKEYIL